ncbi:MAG TPA: acyl dehydratase [Stellaceae bacterium]|nr:acyl dehydratase [Stellaceae bacterium]
MAEFARLYDPQRFHLEEGEGGAAPIASGWYTVGLMMRLFVRDFLPTVASLPSPGIDELRWLAPVRAGDRLMLRLTVLDSRYSRTRPDRGIVRSRAEILNQDDEPVMTMLLTSFIAARPTTG